MEKNQITLEDLKRQNTEKYFQEVLSVIEFEGLKTLVADSRGVVSWRDLAEEWVVKVEWDKIEGIYWKWNLDFRRTKIKSLGKLKEVKWYLYLSNIETLEDLWELEEVWGHLRFRRIKIKSLGKLRKVWGTFWANIGTLEDLWELEEIGWDLFLKETPIEFQKKTLKKIAKKELVVKENIYLWWKKTEIDELLNIKGIRWSFDISLLNIIDKITIIKRIAKEKLTVTLNWFTRIGKKLEWLYTKWSLNLEEYKNIFGEDIKKLEDEETKRLAIIILQKEYENITEELKKEVKRIVEENQGKNLTEEEKKKIRKEIKNLETKLLEFKSKIENFGLKL